MLLELEGRTTAGAGAGAGATELDELDAAGAGAEALDVVLEAVAASRYRANASGLTLNTVDPVHFFSNWFLEFRSSFHSLLVSSTASR